MTLAALPASRRRRAPRARPHGWRASRAMRDWTRRLVAFFTLACLAVVACASPLCEIACALEHGHATAAAHAGQHTASDARHHGKHAAPHEGAEPLHAAACHLSVAAVIPRPEPVSGPFDVPVVWSSPDRAAIASMSWPPPKRPPRPGTFA